MAKLETKMDTTVGLSEKISVSFMVATGLIVVTSFLAAAGYAGWRELTGAAPVTEIISEAPLTNQTTDLNEGITEPNVKGETEDYIFSTE
jgi:hypothetical protein